jgi:hypothetical protein
MKGEKSVQEKISLLEKELMTLTDKVEEIASSLKVLDDLASEIKALKVFISRLHPELKDQFPDIIKKVTKKR